MSPLALRCILAACCLASALVAGWIIYQNLSESSHIQRYRRVAGIGSGIAGDGSYLVELVEPGVARGNGRLVAVGAENNSAPQVGQSVELYLDPTGELPPMLGDPQRNGALPPLPSGSFDRKWALTVTLMVLSCLLFAAALYLLLVGTLPNGWIWSSPAPWAPPPNAVIGNWDRRIWRICAFWALFGLLPLLGMLIQFAITRTIPAIAWIWVAGGLTLSASICGFALHLKTYRMWVDEASLRQSSAFGWQEIAWTDVGAMEDRSEEVLDTKDDFLGDSRPSHSRPQTTWRHYVRLLDRQGRTLTDISDGLAQQQAIVLACSARTRLLVVKKLIPRREFRFWGGWSKKQ